MKTTWDRIHIWLAANAPTVLTSLRPGASEEAIHAAEAAMGVTFPDDVRETYRLHDGQEWDAPFLYGRFWNCLGDMVESWQRFQKTRARRGDSETPPNPDTSPNEATRPDYWHPAWIPLATDDNGGYFCLDLDPGPTGQRGQIIYWWRDMDSPRRVAAISFASFLEVFANELEAGEWTTDPDFNGLVRVDEAEEQKE